MKIKNNIIRCVTIVFLSLLLCSSVIFAHSWMAPKEEAQKQNPIPLTDASINNSKDIFDQNCAYCHGNHGTGLKAKVAKLKKDTPNLIKRLKNHTEGDFHWKIKNGKSEMPSFGDDLTDNEIWNVINYLKSLSK